MTRATDIVGYTFKADTYCPDCIIGVLPTGDGQEFEGWALATDVRMSVENNLNEIAAAFQIDRMDERSFDSSEFPKVIFSSQVEQPERCSNCHNEIDGE